MIIEVIYKSRSPRVYKKYAPTLRINCGGGGLLTVEKSNKSKNKLEIALRETIDRYDYILERRDGNDFVEIIGSVGGDIERVRVYKDGSVFHK